MKYRKIGRRQYAKVILAGGAVAGLTGFAGCTDDTTDEGSTGDTIPEIDYSVSVQGSDTDDFLEDEYTPHQDERIEFEIDINRVLEGGENTDLGPDTLEITNAYAVRDHEEYSKEFFEENDILYENITDELEFDEEHNLVRMSSEVIIPGQTEIGLDIKVTNEDHNQEYTTSLTDTTYMEPSNIEEIHLQDTELWRDLRDDFIKERLKNAGNPGDDFYFYDAAQKIEEELDLEGKEPERKYELIAREWINHARDITQGASVSGQADFLDMTIEYLFDDKHGFTLADLFHNTSLVYNEEEDKIYHVENALRGETMFPPGEAAQPLENKGHNPLYTTEDNLTEAEITVYYAGRLDLDLIDQFDASEEFLVSSMGEIREGVDWADTQEFIQQFGLTAHLSPSQQFKIQGKVDEPELKLNNP
ncbi:hypothetical protein [Halorubrum vacuolatum]|uniref:Uncharacterized protein n=1 Tax=Halorubrum vacuolatum TaxID=63740 RepID=A0A238YCA9_HALVU|nr:hypothetical protein [Halorubrum vacuolatum]SNR68875.1 hypothetical protein SAMN06264855_1387 [Halorubrum vacuolatum]